jgi:putative transposase
MPRLSRIVLPDVPLHVIQRGNNHQACFVDESDHCAYLSILEKYAIGCGCAIHAYVLMTNHVHLLLSPREQESAAAMMKQLGQQYVQYFNRRHGRSGSLWEGRFRSCLVQDEMYLLICQRYIELNPVRAGMVASPEAYRWSSFHANALGKQDSLVKEHAAYRALAGSDPARQRAYRSLFGEVLPDSMLAHLRQASNGNFSFGSEVFEQSMQRAAGRPMVPQTAGRHRSAKRISDKGQESGTDPD